MSVYIFDRPPILILTDFQDLSYPDIPPLSDSHPPEDEDVKPPKPPVPPLPVRPASKRRKVSHELINGSPTTPSPASISRPISGAHTEMKAVPPLPFRPKQTASSSRSKVCSEGDCTNLIPIDVPASRCMSCISKAWKTKRSQGITLRRPQPKKGVSWADREEHDEFDLKKVLQSLSSISSSGNTTPVSSSGNDDVISGWDSDLTELSNSDEEGSTSDGDSEADSDDESSSSEDVRICI